jgi:hypothetical protein
MKSSKQKRPGDDPSTKDQQGAVGKKEPKVQRRPRSKQQPTGQGSPPNPGTGSHVLAVLGALTASIVAVTAFAKAVALLLKAFEGVV